MTGVSGDSRKDGPITGSDPGSCPSQQAAEAALVAPRTVHHASVSVRLRRRTAVFIGLATGRYWTWGASHSRWHSDVRLPFAQVGIVRALPDREHRVRLTFMGWRGADHAPAPAFREWRWPTQRGDQAAASCPCCACSPGLERADHCPATCDCWAEQPITNGPSSLTERDDSGPSVMPADLHAKTTT